MKRSLKQLENRCHESKRLPTELDDKELYVIVRQKSSNSKYKDVYITTHMHAQAVIFTYKNTYRYRQCKHISLCVVLVVLRYTFAVCCAPICMLNILFGIVCGLCNGVGVLVITIVITVFTFTALVLFLLFYYTTTSSLLLLLLC